MKRHVTWPLMCCVLAGCTFLSYHTVLATGVHLHGSLSAEQLTYTLSDILNLDEILGSETIVEHASQFSAFNTYLAFGIDDRVPSEIRRTFLEELNWKSDFVFEVLGVAKRGLQMKGEAFKGGYDKEMYLSCMKGNSNDMAQHLKVILGNEDVEALSPVPLNNCYYLTASPKRVQFILSQAKIRRSFLHNKIEFILPLPPPLKTSPFLMETFLFTGMGESSSEKSFVSLIVELSTACDACVAWVNVLDTLGYPGVRIIPDDASPSLLDVQGLTTRTYFPITMFLSLQPNVRSIEPKLVYTLPPVEVVPPDTFIPFTHLEYPDDSTSEHSSADQGGSRKLHNYDASWQLQGDSLVAWSNGIFGADQVVGCADTAISTSGCYFESEGKIVDYINHGGGEATTNGIDHGTHVVGTILGKTEEPHFNYWNGVAPDAKVAFFAVSDGSSSLVIPSNFYGEVLMTAYMKGARIHSNSWGSGMNYYDSISQQIDHFTYNYQDMLVLFAVGNDGKKSAMSFERYFNEVPTLANATNSTILSSWWSRGGTAGAPSVAKNALAIGSIVNLNQERYMYENPQYLADSGSVSAFSSYGPTFDGRIKPDLVAAGQYVFSADSRYYCGLAGLGGTSMATPVAAGAAALVREYFTKGYYTVGAPSARKIIVPPGALIKAALINSGQPVKRVLTSSYGQAKMSTLYDEYQGFGRVSLEHALRFPDTTFDLFAISTNMTNRLADDVSFEPTFYNSGNTNHTFVIQASGDFKVSVVWMDPPGKSNVALMLVNDIDLSIINLGNGVVHYPNGRTGTDNVNVVEQVWIIASEEGANDEPMDYAVTVSINSLRQGNPQPYAMVATADQIHTVKINGTILQQNGYLWSSDRSFRSNQYSAADDTALWNDGSEWMTHDENLEGAHAQGMAGGLEQGRGNTPPVLIFLVMGVFVVGLVTVAGILNEGVVTASTVTTTANASGGGMENVQPYQIGRQQEDSYGEIKQGGAEL